MNLKQLVTAVEVKRINLISFTFEQTKNLQNLNLRRFYTISGKQLQMFQRRTMPPFLGLISPLLLMMGPED
jgi:hypothetical protein